MNKFLLGSVSALLLMTSASASAATIISAQSAVIDSGGPGFGSIANTHNQNGLLSGYTSGVTNFNTYIASNPMHGTTFSTGEWFSNSGSTAAQVTYDLGSILGIDRLALWNEESSGIGILNLFGSTDGITFASLGTYNPVPSTSIANYGAQVFSFGATNARFVRFGMSRCPAQGGVQGFPGCAIGEVAFRSADVGGAVPEPSVWAFMLVGFGAIGGALRSKRRKPNPTAAYA